MENIAHFPFGRETRASGSERYRICLELKSQTWLCSHFNDDGSTYRYMESRGHPSWIPNVVLGIKLI